MAQQTAERRGSTKSETAPQLKLPELKMSRAKFDKIVSDLISYGIPAGFLIAAVAQLLKLV